MAKQSSQTKANKMKRLTATLEEHFADSAKLEKTIRRNLKSLGHE